MPSTLIILLVLLYLIDILVGLILVTNSLIKQVYIVVLESRIKSIVLKVLYFFLISLDLIEVARICSSLVILTYVSL